MPRKKKFETQFEYDENGHLLTEDGPVETVVYSPMTEDMLNEILVVCMYCSRDGDTTYELGQFGPLGFTVGKVGKFAERLGIECQTKDVQKVLSKLMSIGYLTKAHGKREYHYNPDWAKPPENYNEELENFKANRPMKL